ncbi:MAG: GNAT family N-acetyltransferase [Patescibacteria group bacterium]
MDKFQFQIKGKEKQVEIKVATVSNLKDIQDLNHQLCTKEAKEFDPTINENYPIQKEGEEYFKERIENGCALVADVDSRIVGYLIGGISKASDYRNISKIAEAENMYVLEEYRSFGIGGKLFQEFIDWCKARGIEKMKVVVSSKNTKAIDFYKKEGFEDYDVTLEKTL